MVGDTGVPESDSYDSYLCPRSGCLLTGSRVRVGEAPLVLVRVERGGAPEAGARDVKHAPAGAARDEALVLAPASRSSQRNLEVLKSTIGETQMPFCFSSVWFWGARETGTRPQPPIRRRCARRAVVARPRARRTRRLRRSRRRSARARARVVREKEWGGYGFVSEVGCFCIVRGETRRFLASSERGHLSVPCDVCGGGGGGGGGGGSDAVVPSLRSDRATCSRNPDTSTKD